jgi:UDP-N-acetylmuramoylalanine--D-glutamate ligase
MKIAILGFADQGQSSYEYWNNNNNQITICDIDKSIKVPNDVRTKLGKDSLKNLDEFDLLIRTPALHPSKIVAANSDKILAKVTSNTNEFFKVCPTKNIIGVTGTKGKGTTSTLIANILKTAGKTVHLGGNIGTPPLDLLKNNIKKDDWVVLELANFQLIDLMHSPKIAVCLMVEPEHMDWHRTLKEYLEAKQQLFVHQSSKDIAIHYSKNRNSMEVASAGSGKNIAYMDGSGANIIGSNLAIDNHKIMSVKDFALLGKHNWQNICAAVTTAWQITKDKEAIKVVLANFKGLEHRLELVRRLDGVEYFDDSFGTTPSTAQVAIEAFEKPKILILGGSDKGASYETLAKTVVKNNVKQVLLIGQQSPAIAKSLDTVGYKNYTSGGKNMKEIVNKASKLASTGDVVILSPACASFDMFRNYKDRGDQFKDAVLAL